MEQNGVENNKNKHREGGFSTNAIHAGQEPEKWDSRCVVPPIVLSTTFKQFGPGDCVYDYSRSGNPTRNMLEECLATLEKAKYALCFSSGLGATTTLSYLLETGSHVLICDDVYGGSNRFFRHCASRMGITSTFIDMLNIDNVKKGLKENTRMVWIETPTNPTLKIIDIKAVCDVVRETHPNAVIVSDNTFSSSFFQVYI
jgi:cystathionine gamma-lyase